MQVFYALINTIRKNGLLYFWACDWYLPGSSVILIWWRLSKCVCWESWTIKELGVWGGYGRDEKKQLQWQRARIMLTTSASSITPSRLNTIPWQAEVRHTSVGGRGQLLFHIYQTYHSLRSLKDISNKPWLSVMSQFLYGWSIFLF